MPNEERINMLSLNNEIERLQEDSEKCYMVNFISPTKG